MSATVTLLFFFLLLPPPPSSTLFPYTTLFRSERWREAGVAPDQITAYHVENDRVTMTRPLCPYPQVAAYKGDRKSTRLNSSHGYISYAVFCLKKKNNKFTTTESGLQETNHHPT